MLPFLKTRYSKLYSAVPGSEDDRVYPNTETFRWTKVILDVLGLLGILILVLIFYMFAPSPRLLFSPNDPALMYPIVTSAVSSAMVALLSLFVPIALVILCNLFFFWSFRDLYAGIMASLFAYALALYLTSIIWYFIGGLRPNFLAHCRPNVPSVSSSVYYDSSICSQQSEITRDTFHGFPSGHASTAFAAATFMSTYLASHFGLYRNGNGVKILLCIAPLMFALWLSACRILDFHHTALQVFAGALMGILSALVAYKLFYVNGFWFGYGRWSHVPIMTRAI